MNSLPPRAACTVKPGAASPAFKAARAAVAESPKQRQRNSASDFMGAHPSLSRLCGGESALRSASLTITRGRNRPNQRAVIATDPSPHPAPVIPNPVECFLRRHCEARHAPKLSRSLSALLLDRHGGKRRRAGFGRNALQTSLRGNAYASIRLTASAASVRLATRASGPMPRRSSA